MKTLVLAAMLAGCVTAEGVVKQEGTPLSWLVAGTAGDLVAVGVIAKEGAGMTVGASVATALAITAVDVFVGCLLGACSSLRL